MELPPQIKEMMHNPENIKPREIKQHKENIKLLH